MRIECKVEEVDLLNDDGAKVRGVCVTCGECGHQTESFGTQDKSIKRCLVLLREECPEDENNFYVTEDD